MDMQEILSKVITSTNEIFQAEAGSVALLDPDSQQMVIRAAVGAGSDAVRDMRIPANKGIIGWVLAHEKPALVPDVSQDSRFYQAVDETSGFQTRSVMCVPMQTGGRTIGVIELMNMCPDYIGENGLKILSVIADHAALAIENARLREMERQLQQTEKLSAIGKLVAGVAHELNNPLTAIIGYTGLLQEVELPATYQADLEVISRQAQRARLIVRNLLTFARKVDLESEPVEISKIIDASLLALKPNLQAQAIQVIVDIDPQLPMIMADPHRLEQVFINLLTNAVQALGLVTGRRQIMIEARSVGDMIRLRFADTGPGIPEPVLHRIFDPFFSTKEVGDGTGLGLSICFGIISEHKGRIWAENAAEGGAVFFIELPMTQSSPRPAVKAAPPPQEQPIDPLRILIVDDEPTLLHLMSRVLQPLGHLVDAVPDGATALQMLGGQPYDLVICDMLMPDILGPDLYRQSVEAVPSLARRFIFITGNAVDVDTRHFLESSGLPWLAKPFLPAEIEQAVRQAAVQNQD